MRFAWLLAITACSSSAATPVESPPPGWIRMHGVVTEDGLGATLEGYEICLTKPTQDPARCVKSASDGAYTLYVPPKSQIVTTYVKEGYFREIGMTVTESTDLEVNFAGLLLERGPLLASSVSATLDATKGQLVFSIFGPGAFVPNGAIRGFPGVTVTLAPASGIGPFYTDAANVPAKALTASSTGTLGGVLNVDPGAITAIFKAPAGKNCRLLAGWPGPTPGGVSFHVEPATITHISAACE